MWPPKDIISSRGPGWLTVCIGLALVQHLPLLWAWSWQLPVDDMNPDPPAARVVFSECWHILGPFRLGTRGINLNYIIPLFRRLICGRQRPSGARTPWNVTGAFAIFSLMPMCCIAAPWAGMRPSHGKGMTLSHGRLGKVHQST